MLSMAFHSRKGTDLIILVNIIAHGKYTHSCLADNQYQYYMYPSFVPAMTLLMSNTNIIGLIICTHCGLNDNQCQYYMYWSFASIVVLLINDTNIICTHHLYPLWAHWQSMPVLYVLIICTHCGATDKWYQHYMYPSFILIMTLLISNANIICTDHLYSLWPH